MRTPLSVSDAASGAGAETLRRLAANAVARLNLGAAAVLLEGAGHPPVHTSGAPEHQQALLAAILHLGPPLRDARNAGETRVFRTLPTGQPSLVFGPSLAIVPLPNPGEAPAGSLVALHLRPWSAGEVAALECMAAEAMAEIRAQAADEALREAQARLELLERALAAVDRGLTITDETGAIVYTNPAEADMHGYRLDEMYGLPARALAPPELWSAQGGVPARPVRRWVRERVNVRRDGTRFPVRLWSDIVAAEDERPMGLVTWCEDLSGREEPPTPAPAGDVDRDALTRLPDRAAFLRALQLACEARAARGAEFAVLFVDLDRFKTVNDRLGHAAGDALLAVVGERLAASIRPRDMVARIGGDEFAALLYGVDREQDALAVVQRIQRLLAAPVTIEGVEMRCSASIGVAVGACAETPEGVLAMADRAMYRAKTLGAGHHGFSEPGVMAHEEALLEVEKDLLRAIDRDELTLHFQPIVCLADGRVEGLEALVRWNHPERGLLGPQAFLPVAEETGKIVDLDRWVLAAAAGQLKAWTDHPLLRDVPVSINFSGRHVVHPRAVQDVTDALARFGVDARRLMIEVTETSFMEDFQTAASVLATLRELGVRICLDDFGTGYSSLAYLRQFGFDRLKIDRSFVQRINESAADQAIVRSIVGLADALELAVTAEGVETAAQHDAVHRLGCRHAQGFLFARPMPVDALEGWLAAPR
jgi:diguanylate cyclase (GGDEF)-like protein/PAS domain S-box-containing protein